MTVASSAEASAPAPSSPQVPPGLLAPVSRLEFYVALAVVAGVRYAGPVAVAVAQGVASWLWG